MPPRTDLIIGSVLGSPPRDPRERFLGLTQRPTMGRVHKYPALRECVSEFLVKDVGDPCQPDLKDDIWPGRRRVWRGDVLMKRVWGCL